MMFKAWFYELYVRMTDRPNETTMFIRLSFSVKPFMYHYVFSK